MINRRLFTTVAAAVLFGCFISTAFSACGRSGVYSIYSDMNESESYRVLDYSDDDTAESADHTVPETEIGTTEGTAESTRDGQQTETVLSGTIPNTTENRTTGDGSASTDGSSSASSAGDRTTANEPSSTVPDATVGTTVPPTTAGAPETSGSESQSSEAFQVQNPVKPADHSIEFFFKVPAYTGKNYYDQYLNDGFVPIRNTAELSDYCQKALLTLADGRKSVRYVITPRGLFDLTVSTLAQMDEKAAAGRSIVDIYARDAYLYEELGLDYQTYYSRGLSIFKIKKMGDVGNGKHSIYAIYYYSYEDPNQTAAVERAVEQAVAGCKGGDYDKILYAYDYLCGNTVYSDDTDSFEAHSAYGALVSGKAVCEGYAKAYKLLLDKMGIPNYIVINSTHAWNVVRYNGEWYFVDVTNGDFNSCYAYFMLGGDVLCNAADILIDSYIFTTESIAYYGYMNGSNTDANALAKSSIPERNITYR